MIKYLIFALSVIISLFFSACTIQDNKAEEHNLAGIEHVNFERYSEAIQEYQTAFKLSNNKDSKVVYLRNIGNAYHDLEQMDSSLYYLTKARDLAKPGSFEFYLNQGDIHILNGNIKEGIKELKRAAKKRPASSDVNNVLALIYTGRYGEEHTDYEKALKYNKAAYELNKSDILIKKELAKNYYILDQFEEAEILFSELLEFDSTNLVNQFNLAITKYYMDKNEPAKEMFLKINKEDSSLLIGYEDIMSDLGIQ